MPPFYILRHPSVVVFLAPVAAAIARLASSAPCDAGQFAEILSSRHVSSKELWSLCSSHYSEGICNSAGRMLRASHHRKDSGSYQQWAKSACDAVEAASSQQRTLLLRQGRAAPRQAGAESKRLADIRNSASVHKLSLDVAQRYHRESGSVTTAQSEGSLPNRSSLSVDASLQHKSIPIPHGTFKWESTNKPNSSAAMDKLVGDYLSKHAKAVNEASPESQRRSNAFKPVSAASVAPTVPATSAAPHGTGSGTGSLAESAASAALATVPQATAPQAAPKATSAAASVNPAAPGASAAHVAQAALVALSHLRQPPRVASIDASKLDSPALSKKAVAENSDELERLVEEVMGRPPTEEAKMSLKLTR